MASAIAKCATQFSYDNILCQLMRFFGSAFAFAPTSIEAFIMRSHTHIHRDTHTQKTLAVSLIMQLSMKCGKRSRFFLRWVPMVSVTAKKQEGAGAAKN